MSCQSTGAWLDLCRTQWCSQDERCHRLQLNDLLISPMQHCTKVPLLLNNIHRYTVDPREQQLLSVALLKLETSLRESHSLIKLDMFSVVTRSTATYGKIISSFLTDNISMRHCLIKYNAVAVTSEMLWVAYSVSNLPTTVRPTIKHKRREIKSLLTLADCVRYAMHFWVNTVSGTE